MIHHPESLCKIARYVMHVFQRKGNRHFNLPVESRSHHMPRDHGWIYASAKPFGRSAIGKEKLAAAETPGTTPADFYRPHKTLIHCLESPLATAKVETRKNARKPQTITTRKRNAFVGELRLHDDLSWVRMLNLILDCTPPVP